MKVDYIIVGCGLAGISFAELARQANKTFVVINNDSQRSSTVAAGLYNPVLLKRFSEVWKAKEQLELLKPFYGALEQLLKVKLDHAVSIFRMFASVEEQNNWFQACDNPKVQPYLDAQINLSKFQHISGENGFGKVLHSGRIDTALLISAYKQFLQKNKLLLNESFDHQAFSSKPNGVAYKDLDASHMVFAEGFGIKSNPFFNKLPLNGTKGELLTIHAPELNLNVILKSSVFIIPLGNDQYRVGATYNRNDKTNAPSEEGKHELVSKLNKIIECPYSIVNHLAGMRPTVKDRRPLVGAHDSEQNMYVLNGFGSRGVMIAPYVATALFKNIEEGTPIDPEINCNRFTV